MVNIVVELSKYLILTLMVLYTFYSIHMVRVQGRPGKEEGNQRRLARQLFLTFLLLTNAFLVLYLKTGDVEVPVYYGLVVLFFFLLQIFYHILYPGASRLLLNDACMLMGIGFIMLCRLDMDAARKQFMIAAGASALSLLVPVLIRRWRSIKKLTWLYGGTGVLLLGAVFLLARTSYGAKLSLMGIQPSEAIKITFVFFLASLLWRRVTWSKMILATLVSALHVGILVLSRDLGTAVIFFVVYLVMVYASARSPLYLAIGTVGGSGAAIAAYHLFAHVRERVSAWQHPMKVYENEGYQIVQSLFAIGTGGWFGMGLCQGSPEKIPVVKNDFIFSAICEELGGIFGICLIVICICFFLMMLDVAMAIKSPFYKLVALGLGTEYAFQVFLTIGGATKFIPMTGVTLPLVSYGGSSLVCTIMMLAIIQGLYIYREDEDEEIERLRRQALGRKNLFQRWEKTIVPPRGERRG